MVAQTEIRAIVLLRDYDSSPGDAVSPSEYVDVARSAPHLGVLVEIEHEVAVVQAGVKPVFLYGREGMLAIATLRSKQVERDVVRLDNL